MAKGRTWCKVKMEKLAAYNHALPREYTTKVWATPTPEKCNGTALTVEQQRNRLLGINPNAGCRTRVAAPSLTTSADMRASLYTPEGQVTLIRNGKAV